MFSTSTQRRYWIFPDTTELQRLRGTANREYMTAKQPQHGLSMAEEQDVRLHYEWVLHDFCKRFQPPMPPAVIGTSMAYYKRFYLHKSVMDYHPELVYMAAAYLASKIEEFNVSLAVFVENLKSAGHDIERCAEAILWLEPVLMKELNFHLTIHNPYRPLEGWIIDIKTRSPELGNIESLRGRACEFLDRCLHSDCSLIYSPSQVALSALLDSASNTKINLTSFLQQHISLNSEQELAQLTKFTDHIRHMTNSVKRKRDSSVNTLLDKLNSCKNPLHDPSSAEFQENSEHELQVDNQHRAARRKRFAEEQAEFERECMAKQRPF